ncbi:MAG: hypothetical protein K6B13_09135, partial [Prevotella sp.]|nr:hypothetical protein [Prevotella sp.]
EENARGRAGGFARRKIKPAGAHRLLTFTVLKLSVIFLYISDFLSEAFGRTVRSLRTERPKPSDNESEAFGQFRGA